MYFSNANKIPPISNQYQRQYIEMTDCNPSPLWVSNISEYMQMADAMYKHFCNTRVHACGQSRPSTAPGMGVCEWSPEVLYDKSVSLIPNTDEILKLVKKKLN